MRRKSLIRLGFALFTFSTMSFDAIAQNNEKDSKQGAAFRRFFDLETPPNGDILPNPERPPGNAPRLFLYGPVGRLGPASSQYGTQDINGRYSETGGNGGSAALSKSLTTRVEERSSQVSQSSTSPPATNQSAGNDGQTAQAPGSARTDADIRQDIAGQIDSSDEEQLAFHPSAEGEQNEQIKSAEQARFTSQAARIATDLDRHIAALDSNARQGAGATGNGGAVPSPQPLTERQEDRLRQQFQKDIANQIAGTGGVANGYRPSRQAARNARLRVAESAVWRDVAGNIGSALRRPAAVRNASARGNTGGYGRSRVGSNVRGRGKGFGRGRYARGNGRSPGGGYGNPGGIARGPAAMPGLPTGMPYQGAPTSAAPMAQPGIATSAPPSAISVASGGVTGNGAMTGNQNASPSEANSSEGNSSGIEGTGGGALGAPSGSAGGMPGAAGGGAGIGASGSGMGGMSGGGGMMGGGAGGGLSAARAPMPRMAPRATAGAPTLPPPAAPGRVAMNNAPPASNNRIAPQATNPTSGAGKMATQSTATGNPAPASSSAVSPNAPAGGQSAGPRAEGRLTEGNTPGRTGPNATDPRGSAGFASPAGSPPGNGRASGAAGFSGVRSPTGNAVVNRPGALIGNAGGIPDGQKGQLADSGLPGPVAGSGQTARSERSGPNVETGGGNRPLGGVQPGQGAGQQFGIGNNNPAGGRSGPTQGGLQAPSAGGNLAGGNQPPAGGANGSGSGVGMPAGPAGGGSPLGSGSSQGNRLPSAGAGLPQSPLGMPAQPAPSNQLVQNGSAGSAAQAPTPARQSGNNNPASGVNANNASNPTQSQRFGNPAIDPRAPGQTGNTGRQALPSQTAPNVATGGTIRPQSQPTSTVNQPSRNSGSAAADSSAPVDATYMLKGGTGQGQCPTCRPGGIYNHVSERCPQCTYRFVPKPGCGSDCWVPVSSSGMANRQPTIGGSSSNPTANVATGTNSVTMPATLPWLQNGWNPLFGDMPPTQSLDDSVSPLTSGNNIPPNSDVPANNNASNSSSIDSGSGGGWQNPTNYIPTRDDSGNISSSPDQQIAQRIDGPPAQSPSDIPKNLPASSTTPSPATSAPMTTPATTQVTQQPPSRMRPRAGCTPLGPAIAERNSNNCGGNSASNAEADRNTRATETSNSPSEGVPAKTAKSPAVQLGDDDVLNRLERAAHDVNVAFNSNPRQPPQEPASSAPSTKAEDASEYAKQLLKVAAKKIIPSLGIFFDAAKQGKILGESAQEADLNFQKKRQAELEKCRRLDENGNIQAWAQCESLYQGGNYIIPGTDQFAKDFAKTYAGRELERRARKVVNKELEKEGIPPFPDKLPPHAP